MLHPRILALALLSRTLSNLKGVAILTERGLAVEARTLARCCYENLFMVGNACLEGLCEWMTTPSIYRRAFKTMARRRRCSKIGGSEFKSHFSNVPEEAARHWLYEHWDTHRIARFEPPRVCRRLFGLSYAAIAGASSMA